MCGTSGSAVQTAGRVTFVYISACGTSGSVRVCVCTDGGSCKFSCTFLLAVLAAPRGAGVCLLH